MTQPTWVYSAGGGQGATEARRGPPHLPLVQSEMRQDALLLCALACQLCLEEMPRVEEMEHLHQVAEASPEMQLAHFPKGLQGNRGGPR